MALGASEWKILKKNIWASTETHSEESTVKMKFMVYVRT